MKTLVTYFSAQGTTKRVGHQLAELLNADEKEIMPKVPYSAADLNWNDKQSRSSREMNDKSYRPEIIVDQDLSDYNRIFVGFPIWWYTCPTIILTYLESYDFTNKTIVPFATSGGSGIGGAMKDIKAVLPQGVTVLEGKRMNHVSKRDVKEWL